MTISTTDSRASFNGNGVTVAFAFPYLFFANGDLDVYLVSASGVVTLQVLDTDYTVTGAGDEAGGTVTMVVAPAVGERLTISRVVALTQETDYISGDAFPAETHERALDKLTMQTQQLQDQVTRSVTAPTSDPTDIDLTLPPKALRLNGLLSFNSVTGNPEIVLMTDDINALNTNVAAIIDQFNNTNSLSWSGINFDQVSPAAGAVARLKWNDTDGTLDLGLKGGNVTLQLGQEMVHRVLNNTGADFTNGQVVYVTGSSGQRMTGALAQANSEATSSATIGICTEPILNNQEGFITSHGLVRDIDTSTFAEGVAVYLSASVAGGLTTTRPVAPNHGVRIGWVVRSHATQGVIFADVQNGQELNELHDVLITTPSVGHTILWDGAKWVNGVPTVPSATTTSQGIVELATAAEAPDRTKTAVVLTPATLRDAFAAQNDAPIYACRAWANFNGTGTVAIRASGNVSSITDNGTGDYTVNFATALPDANYAMSSAAGETSGTAYVRATVTPNRTTGSCRVESVNNASTLQDVAMVSVSFVR